MKILIDFPRFTPEQATAIQQLGAEHGDHEVYHATTEAEAIDQASEIEVLMGFIRPTVFAAAPNLKWAQSFSAGLDNVLFPELVASDVILTNVAGLYAPQGGEHAWALLLALARGILRSIRRQDQQTWQADQVVSLTGGTMGIIGLGGFGLETGKRAAGYDMTILALDPIRQDKPDWVAELKPSSKENLHDLLRRSDAVMVSCPLIPETYHLISTEEFAVMKETAYLINVTRGGIIDEPALITALETGQIAGAGLDVCEEEPLPADNPLWQAPNLIVTPHRAGFSQHRPREVFEFAYQNLARYLKGEPLANVVGKERGF